MRNMFIHGDKLSPFQYRMKRAKSRVPAVRMFFDSGESGQRRGCAPSPAFDPGRGCLPDIRRGRTPAAQNHYYGFMPGLAPDREPYRCGRCKLE